MYERFTDRARKVMQLANQEAQRFNHEYVGTEHVLLGLVKEGSGVAANVLKNLDVDLSKIRVEVEKIGSSGPDSVAPEKPPQPPRAKKVIEYAIEEARNLNHDYVGTEHLLLGLLREQEGVAAQVLMNLNLKLEEVRDEVLNLLGQGMDAGGVGVERAAAKGGTSKPTALDTFGRDLTDLARQGKLDPVIGRQNEIERVIQVLSRRTKNNPVLLGEAGVGKTAIVEGLAQMIVDGRVPEMLLGRRIVRLDLSMMIAGKKNRGEFENRLKAVMYEVRRAKDTILFIDELHTLVSGDTDLAIAVSNVLRPALARGEVSCIGATTLEKYRDYIEKEGVLDRLFHIVIVNPPSKTEALEILRGIRDRFEAHHRVMITDRALEAAVELSTLYISEPCLPAKATNLIDEAGAHVRLKAMNTPPELKELDEQIERLAKEKEAAVDIQDFERAAALRDQADKLKKRKETTNREWRERSKEVRGRVDEEVISEIVSRLTGIPTELVKKHEYTTIPQRLERSRSGLPKFERSQAESVLHDAREIEINQGFGFVLLPPTAEFNALFETAILPAMAANGIQAQKAEDIYQPGSILAQVWRCIRTAEVIVADMSGGNPNVTYELGLCYGLHRCPILLVRDPSDLPFNLRSLRYIKYENTVAGAERLRTELTRAIQEFLAAARASVAGP